MRNAFVVTATLLVAELGFGQEPKHVRPDPWNPALSAHMRSELDKAVAQHIISSIPKTHTGTMVIVIESDNKSGFDYIKVQTNPKSPDPQKDKDDIFSLPQMLQHIGVNLSSVKYKDAKGTIAIAVTDQGEKGILLHCGLVNNKPVCERPEIVACHAAHPNQPPFICESAELLAPKVQ